MLNHRGLAVFLTLSAGLSAAPSLYAQAYTPPPPPLDAPCKPTKKDPCTPPPSTIPPPKSSMAFPFPGDTSDAVSLDPNANPDDPANKPAQKPAQPADGTGSGGKFPFPGDAPAGSVPGSNSSGSSSSGSSSSDSSSSSSGAPGTAPDDDDPPAPVPASRRHLPKVEDLDTRESKDLEVSSFYFDKGDFIAAYARGKDAVRLMPNDPEAHFVLAQAANRLKKPDEARDEYKLSLKLDVSEGHAKIARNELERLP